MKRHDLNLLNSLDALLRERSVSGAARRMGVGQPAMSAALARLRALLGDPILVRGASGLQPTPRARVLSEPLRQALGALTELLEPAAGFDPATATRTFRLSGGDYVGMAVIPPLIAALRREAPGADLRFRYLEKRAALEALDKEELDLALMVAPEVPARFTSEPLLTETFVGAARSGHPALAEVLSPEQFAAFGHLLVTENGDDTGCVDRALEDLGLRRRVMLTVPSAALVGDVLRASDLITVIPRRAARRITHDGSISLFEPPLDLPGWTMSIVQPLRTAAEPGLSWLRHRLRTVAESTD